MEKNITVIKTTMGVLAKDQVAWKVNLIKWITFTWYISLWPAIFCCTTAEPEQGDQLQ